MKRIIFSTAIIITLIIISSCQVPQQRVYKSPDYSEESSSQDIAVSNSVIIPTDGATPIAGINSLNNPDTVLTFSEIGQKYEIKKGQSVNFIYEGINPEETYIIYESTWDGYTLELAYRSDKLNIAFSRMCQTYIVASPELTTVQVPKNLKYEQIVWTPRSDGTWEVRIGTVERGCQSKALQELQKLRTKDYEGKVPKK